MGISIRMSSNARYKAVIALMVLASLAGCASDSGNESASVLPGTQPVTQPAPGTPVISGTPVTSVQATTLYSFTPTATDPEGNTLVYSVANRPSWATLSSTTGMLSGTPSAAQTGTYAGIVISVSDGTHSASLRSFTIQVTAAPNRPPTITGSPTTSVQANTPYLFQPSATDPENNPLTFSIEGAPTWTTFSATSGRLSGTPTNAHVGITSRITIRVTDGTNTAALPAFNLTVTSVVNGNTPPIISGTPQSSILAGVLYSFAPTASDPNGDALTFTIQNRPTWATFDPLTGRLSGLALFGSTNNIVIGVTDGQATTSLPAFNLSVQQPTGTGTAMVNWAPPTTNTDGSAITNLAGFRIVYGNSATTLDREVRIMDPARTSHLVESLAAGTWYFAVRAINLAGAESNPSSIASKVIP